MSPYLQNKHCTPVVLAKPNKPRIGQKLLRVASEQLHTQIAHTEASLGSGSLGGDTQEQSPYHFPFLVPLSWSGLFSQE